MLMVVSGGVSQRCEPHTRKPRCVGKKHLFGISPGSLGPTYQCWRLSSWHTCGGIGNLCESCLRSWISPNFVYFIFRTDQARIKHDVWLANGTLVDWSSFCRQVCLFIEDSLEPLGGNGRLVEIDESLFGKRKYGKGERDHEGVWVLGGVERITGRCFLKAVEVRNTETLAPILSKHIKKGSVVFSDLWGAYEHLW